MAMTTNSVETSRNFTSLVTPDYILLSNLTSDISTTKKGNSTLAIYDENYDYDYDASMESLPLEEVIPVALVYGFTLLFGLCGNALVIIVVLRNERLRSITNIFLTSLASADLVLVLVCVPVKCAAFFSFTWAFGAFLCKAVHYIQAVSMVCSVMTLTVMSIERNVAILFPLRAKYLCTRGHAQIVIAIIWVVSFAMASPVLVGQTHKEVGMLKKAFWCVPEWGRPGVGLAFDIYMLVLLFLLPVTIMAAAYTGIARALWRGSALRRSMAVPTVYTCQTGAAVASVRGRSWRQRSQTPSLSNSSSNQANEPIGKSDHSPLAHYNRLETTETLLSVSNSLANKSSFNGSGKSARAETKCSRLEQEKVKVVKMLIVVVLLFAICWGPILINNVLVAAGVLNRYHYGYLKPLRQAIFLLSYLNSCLNPLVYSFMSAHFRASFRQAILTCCGFRRRMRSPLDAASFRSRTSTVSFRHDLRTSSAMSTRRQVYLSPETHRIRLGDSSKSYGEETSPPDFEDKD